GVLFSGYSQFVPRRRYESSQGSRAASAGRDNAWQPKGNKQMKPRTKTKTSNSNEKRMFHYEPDHTRRKTNQKPAEIEAFGTLAKLPNGLSERVCQESVERLNQILADTMTLRDMYKKHHWQVAGETFYQLHLLFDKHYDEQEELVDQIAERIQM